MHGCEKNQRVKGCTRSRLADGQLRGTYLHDPLPLLTGCQKTSLAADGASSESKTPGQRSKARNEDESYDLSPVPGNFCRRDEMIFENKIPTRRRPRDNHPRRRRRLDEREADG